MLVSQTCSFCCPNSAFGRSKQRSFRKHIVATAAQPNDRHQGPSLGVRVGAIALAATMSLGMVGPIAPFAHADEEDLSSLSLFERRKLEAERRRAAFGKKAEELASKASEPAGSQAPAARSAEPARAPTPAPAPAPAARFAEPARAPTPAPAPAKSDAPAKPLFGFGGGSSKPKADAEADSKPKAAADSKTAAAAAGAAAAGLAAGAAAQQESSVPWWEQWNTPTEQAAPAKKQEEPKKEAPKKEAAKPAPAVADTKPGKRKGPLPLWFAELLVMLSYVGLFLALTKYNTRIKKELNSVVARLKAALAN